MTTSKTFSKKSARAYVLALTFALMSAFTLPAYAAETVNISSFDTQGAGNVVIMLNEIQVAISTASSGDGIVYVTGTFGGIQQNEYVYLNIPANVTVIWGQYIITAM